MGRISITCPGCGQVLEAGADDPRAEVECLWCGTKTPVAAGQPNPSPPARTRRPEPLPSDPPAPVAPAKPAAEPPPPGPRWFEQTPYSVERRTAWQPAAEPAPPLATPALAPASRSSPPAVHLLKVEDSAAYRLEALPERPCPGCARPLPTAETLCPWCGFDQQAGARQPRTYEPVQRSWETGWSLQCRVRLFLIGQAAALLLGLLAAWILGAWSALVVPWPIFSALTAFLLGTYARTELTRSERGKVRLTQTWRICFVPRPTQAIRISEYEGVASGKAPAADFWDWFVLVILTLSGIVLGVLWWYFIIRPDSFYVALTRDHGFPERTLYWGWDEQRAEDMAKTLHAVAFALA